jgi:hypothetical protein
MILDAYEVFSNGQAVTVDAASTDVIDLLVPGRAPGNALRLKSHITEAFNTLTSLGFQVQSSVDAAFTTPINHQLVTKVLADLTLGAVIDLGELVDGTKQFVRVFYDVTGTAATLGKVTTFLQSMGGDQTFPNQA